MIQVKKFNNLRITARLSSNIESCGSNFEGTHLNWFNVVSDDDELRLLALDQAGDCVDTAAHNQWLLGWCVWLALGSLLSTLEEASLLVLH